MSVTVYRFENQPSAYVELCDYSEVEAQRDKLREALSGLLASHDDFMACGKDKNLGWPDLDWSEDFADRARAVLADTEEDLE